MERDFVDWLRATLAPHEALAVGAGDDAAVLRATGAAQTVVTSDLLADGTHFVAEEIEPKLIGRKCLAANLSDLAAMAAKPLAVTVCLLIPRGGAGPHSSVELARGVMRGVTGLAEAFGVAIAGGDTNVWDGRLAVSITALGVVGPRGPLLRSGAKPGDTLLVTGELGGSIEGHHLAFTPRVREALLLHDRYTLHAGMDITDGLAIDLHRLAAASGVGAVIRAADVPASPSAERLALAAGGEALDHALGDGEDFELLLAVPPEVADSILRDQPLECGVTAIGHITDGPAEGGVWLESAGGARTALPPGGYEHGYSGS
ncbi:MAG: thiamine-phosphate kinase [Planctomycetota bacterium]